MSAFNCRREHHARADSDTTNEFILPGCGCVTARLEILQLPRMLSSRFHTRLRYQSPPSFPSAQSTAVARTTPLIPVVVAVMVEALARDLAVVRITLVLGTVMEAAIPTEGRSLSLQDARSSPRPSWFIRLAHLKLP